MSHLKNAFCIGGERQHKNGLPLSSHATLCSNLNPIPSLATLPSSEAVVRSPRMQPPTASCPPGPSLPPVELRVDNDTMQILFLHSAATSSFCGRPASAGHVGRARGCQPPPPQRQPRAPARPGLPRLRRDTEVILVGGGGGAPPLSACTTASSPPRAAAGAHRAGARSWSCASTPPRPSLPGPP
jgi:hypothetical protein